MNLEEADLQLLHDIANRRALLQAPRRPLLEGALAVTLRRRRELQSELARLEEQWLNRGLASAGLPTVRVAAAEVVENAAPLVQRAARNYGGPEAHHF
jgi:hypothetical protein